MDTTTIDIVLTFLQPTETPMYSLHLSMAPHGITTQCIQYELWTLKLIQWSLFY